MPQIKLLGFFLSISLLCFSCKNETFNPEDFDLEGNWFRVENNKVWGGHNQPSFERGESHYTLSFTDLGEFTKNITVLGTYEGTTLADTNAVNIELGTYTTEEDNIDIVLNKRSWWDAWHEDMDDFETIEINAIRPKYQDMTYKINGNELELVYFVSTDLITEDQEIP